MAIHERQTGNGTEAYRLGQSHLWYDDTNPTADFIMVVHNRELDPHRR